MEREGKRVTKGETIAVVGVGVALLSVVVASWADTRAGMAAMRVEIDDLRTELKQDIADLRAEVKQDIADLRAEVKQDIADLRNELKQDIADVRAELKEDIAELRTDVRRLDDRVDELNVRLVAVEIHTGTVARNTALDEPPDGGDAG